MISKLRMANFKNFEDEALYVGPFTVIAGANASGKSNIRDAFRLLHGIGRGYVLADILGGKYGAEWPPIRGAFNEIIRFGIKNFTLEVSLGELITLDFSHVFDEAALGAGVSGIESASENYGLTIGVDKVDPAKYLIEREELRYMAPPRGEPVLYTSHPGGTDPLDAQRDENHLQIRMAKTGSQRKYGRSISVNPHQPALTQIERYPEVLPDHKNVVRSVVETFEDMRFLDLSPDRMRNPSFPGKMMLGDSGENLPTVLKSIWEDSQLQQTFRDWLRELAPMDVEDFEFPADSTSGRIQLVIVEGGRRLSGYAASDGTLRFLAMLAALLGPNRPRLYFFEEIDNGIHPSRLHLLVELIEKQTAGGDIQVITTTHSPQLLAMLSDESFKYASVVCRQEESQDAVIRRIHELPNAVDLRQLQGLDRLHVSGWFENAIGFAEQ